METPLPLLTFLSTHKQGTVAVDLDRLVNGRMLIQANSGGGKSYALRYLLEQTHGQIQHLVLDPEGSLAACARSSLTFWLAKTVTFHLS